MARMTIRIPDDTHARVKNMARQRGVSVSRLLGELTVVAVRQHDAEARFRALAARGSAKEGLAVLDRLDKSLPGADRAFSGGGPDAAGEKAPA